MKKYDPVEYQRNKVSYIERQRRYKEKHRELIAERQREYRKKTPEKVLEYRQKKYESQRKWLEEYRKGKVCAWCGFEDHRALQFHHKDPLTKEFGIRQKIGKISLRRIQKEIDKCELICANCHQIYHSPE
jgi:hypothetical protein